MHAEIERRQTISQIRDLHASRGCEALSEMNAVASAWTQDVERETRLTLSTMQSLLEGLAGRSGRKALLLVSEGMSLTPGLEATLVIEQLCPGNTAGAATVWYRAPARHPPANAAQVTLYTTTPAASACRLASKAGRGCRSFRPVRAAQRRQDRLRAAPTPVAGALESNKPRCWSTTCQDLAAY